MNSGSAGQLKSSGDDTDPICNKSIIVPERVVALANSFERKDRFWYVKSQIPTDLSIQVDDITFKAHKFPLISKCGYISSIELQPSASEDGYYLKLENFPGGAETFETTLKFCYNLPLDLTPLNVAPLRCASEYLYMTEEFEDRNLISKTEAFITFVVLSSWRDTLTVLRSCANLSPWAENLQIVRRCCDLLAWKACNDNNIPEDVVDSNERCLHNDIATLQIDHFMRVITTMKVKRAKPEIVGKIIMKYAENWLPLIDEDLEGIRGYGFGKSELQFSVNRERMAGSSLGCQELKETIESLVSVLPPQSKAVSCHFLLRLLKTAMVYSASPALISDLEKRAGMVLEDANVCDLLIPNFKNQDQQKGSSSPEVYTIYNVDVVQRIFEYFLMHEQQQQQQQQQVPGKPSISKLLDNYLAEIAKDPCLSFTKFQVLAEMLPENAWKCHDGLYRAIDMFLKTHPSISEHDRRRLCKTMNCEKLSLDACLHAAQNDRLPLRTIVQINTQVLFSEQAKMRMMMQDKQPETKEENSKDKRISRDIEIKTLKEELENVKKKLAELQSDYNELQQEYEKLSSKQKTTQNWGLRWQKMKKSFQIKHEDDETRDKTRRKSSTGPRTSLRRRMSMS
ncbi:BTB/POZ domain-containing protein DOT3 [Cardamine amara subsp. amara]|uniref:BTB/POZ domain-containing protein DOT3 n=1 Tax=Cardamine amara subsp. amara TaxID=228776 RepID=A0ABD1C8H2_CARAN